MPLRMRLIMLVGLVLVASLASGSLLVGWRAVHSVQTELRAALDVGSQTIRNGFDDLPSAADSGKELRRLVSTFNGNRHVRATLLDAQGHPLAASALFVPTQPVPKWLPHLIMSQPPALQLPVPPGIGDGSSILLQTDPTNETSEVWAQSRDAVLVLAVFAALSALLIYVAVGRALRPLEVLAAALQRVGNDDSPGMLAVQGPPELVRLANGFNLMTRRLAAVATQNQRLNERLLTLQAEERADLARDLHDEIGPLLFAVDMTAAAIERIGDADRETEIPAHVQAIHDAVGRMQRHVRMLLGRLRPIQSIGLQAAIKRLVAFWHRRRPDIAFDIAISVEEERLGNDQKETMYRVVQEGVSNAIRHGKPTSVSIAIRHDDGDAILVEVTDDGVGMEADSTMLAGSSRLGLIGMRERVMAMAGTLAIQRRTPQSGLSLVVRLPCEDAWQTDDASAEE